MTYLRLFLSLFAAIVGAPLSAQLPAEFEIFLIPIAPGRVAGAQGSVWVTELSVTNVSDTPVYVARNPSPIPGFFAPLAPRATEVLAGLDRTEVVAGAVEIVERGRGRDVAFTLRVRDVSRQHETWGTVIPVVRENEFFAERFSLAEIPGEAQFRSLLRIYDVNPATPPAVRVRVYRYDAARASAEVADELVAELTPTFTMPTDPTFPASAAIPLHFSLRGTERLRVEIQPLDGAKEYWGMVSVTHNETQHVTLIAPE